MRRRVSNTARPEYPDYGGRGITVCERWEAFENFFEDMGEPPTNKHSIDRHPNNDGNYEPGNCRWATAREQARNKRGTVFVEYKRERRPLIEWCEILGLPLGRTDSRLARGWSVEDAFLKPPRRRSDRPIASRAENRKKLYI